MWKLETYSTYGYKNNVINGAVQNLKQFVIKNIKQSYIRDYEWNYLILHMLQISKNYRVRAIFRNEKYILKIFNMAHTGMCSIYRTRAWRKKIHTPGLFQYLENRTFKSHKPPHSLFYQTQRHRSAQVKQ